MTEQTTENDPAKTAAWMTAQGMQGTRQDIERYARDWLDVRAETGVGLSLCLTHIPSRNRMFRRAEQIIREKTRTRVMAGHRVWVQARESMVFGCEFGVPGVRIVLRRATPDEQESEWEIIPAGHVERLYDPDSQAWELGLTHESFRAPVQYERRSDVRNTLGAMGAYVAVWPEAADWEAWLSEKILGMIAASAATH